MKILAIGNSFSEDATYYLKKIADSAAVELEVVNLYIGGCSIKRHAQNILANSPAYRYEHNGLYTDRMVSISDTLIQQPWDIVTIQQLSGHAGIYDTYGKWASILLDCIRKNAPGAKIYFHETWAYDPDSTNADFQLYGEDQQKMQAAVSATVRRFCKENILPIIPCGTVIQSVRQLPAFNRSLGGLSLCRDGFHMSLSYGRYLLAAVWFETLCKKSIFNAPFVPTAQDVVDGYSAEGFECKPEQIDAIRSVVHQICG